MFWREQRHLLVRLQHCYYRRCNPTVSLPFQPNEAKEDEDKKTKELSEEEVQTRIQQYNSQVSEIGMNLVSLKASLDELCTLCPVCDGTSGALYSEIFLHLIPGLRWNLHWLHQGQPAPQPARHGFWCGRAGGTDHTQRRAIREP